MRTADPDVVNQTMVRHVTGIRVPAHQVEGVQDGVIIDTDATNAQLNKPGFCRVKVPAYSQSVYFANVPYAGRLSPPNGTKVTVALVPPTVESVAGVSCRILTYYYWGMPISPLRLRYNGGDAITYNCVVPWGWDYLDADFDTDSVLALDPDGNLSPSAPGVRGFAFVKLSGHEIGGHPDGTYDIVASGVLQVEDSGAGFLTFQDTDANIKSVALPGAIEAGDNAPEQVVNGDSSGTATLREIFNGYNYKVYVLEFDNFVNSMTTTFNFTTVFRKGNAWRVTSAETSPSVASYAPTACGLTSVTIDVAASALDGAIFIEGV